MNLNASWSGVGLSTAGGPRTNCHRAARKAMHRLDEGRPTWVYCAESVSARGS